MDSLQSPSSLIQRRLAEAQEISWCRGTGTRVCGPMPSDSHELRQKNSEHALTTNDWRRKSPEFGEPKFSMNIALRDTLGRWRPQTSSTCRQPS